MIPYESEPTLRRIGLTKGWATERGVTTPSQLLHNNGLRCAWGAVDRRAYDVTQVGSRVGASPMSLESLRPPSRCT